MAESGILVQFEYPTAHNLVDVGHFIVSGSKQQRGLWIRPLIVSIS